MKAKGGGVLDVRSGVSYCLLYRSTPPYPRLLGLRGWDPEPLDDAMELRTLRRDDAGCPRGA